MNPEKPKFVRANNEEVFSTPRPDNSEEMLKARMQEDFEAANTMNSQLPDAKNHQNEKVKEMLKNLGEDDL